jgi:hypothetical protein
MVAIAVTARISLDINMALVTAGISLDDLVVTTEGISLSGLNLTTGIIAFAAAEAPRLVHSSWFSFDKR